MFCVNPIAVKCTSVKGELLRISTVEFQRKIMCYSRVAA